MYQAPYGPHLYMQFNNTHIPGHDMIFYEDGSRPTERRISYSDEFLHSMKDMSAPAYIPYSRNQNVVRNSNYWVPRRNLRGYRTQNSPAFLEYESDDSSRSTTNRSYDGKGYPPLFRNKTHYNADRNSPRAQKSNTLGWHQPISYNIHPVPIIAPDRFLMKAHRLLVKNTPAALKAGSKWDNLSSDIWHKFVRSQQTEETFKNKMTLWKFLYIAIKTMFPRHGLYLVGSTISGFGANSSDMDLCLVVKTIDSLDSRSQAMYHLDTTLCFIKSRHAEFSDAQLIKAKVPILKFRDNRYSFEVDLNCNNVVGIRNTHLLYCYSQLDWRVRPLVLTVKLWAQHHNINDAKNMTVSSYSLVLMVIHYLQCGTSPSVLPCLQEDWPSKFSNNLDIHHIDLMEQMPSYNTKNEQPLGELLLGFFKYYTDFEYTKNVVSVRTGSCLNLEECRAARKNEPHQWKLLCVEEPFDLSNTARSVYDPKIFSHILEVFKSTAEALENNPTFSSLLSP